MFKGLLKNKINKDHMRPLVLQSLRTSLSGPSWQRLLTAGVDAWAACPDPPPSTLVSAGQRPASFSATPTAAKAAPARRKGS